GSEDCLYLNVYRPSSARRGDKLPVMVYLHGGANVAGGASEYDGARFAFQNQAVVITVQSRLGAWGFANLPEAQGPAAGSLGVADAVEALRWVRRNAAAFAGDPGHVTLAGQSSGATNACRILVDRGARGLFGGAILQSDDCLHDVDEPARSLERTRRFLELAGCGEAGDALACLQAAPAERLQLASSGAGLWNPVAGSPAVKEIARGNWAKVPVLLGSNRDEGRAAARAFAEASEDDYGKWVADLMGPENAEKALMRYPAYKYSSGHPVAYVAADLITDSGMRGLGGCANLALARSLVAGGAPAVYLYEFQDGAAPMEAQGGYALGATHGAELAYLWPDSGRFQARHARMTEEQRQLVVAMRRWWGAFVRGWSPAVKQLPAWPSYSKDKAFMALRPGKGATASEALPAEDFAERHKCSFWDSVPPIMKR
ncbi:MAG: carboxylesterase family protein, partial [Duodenibacillus sp.]|nr:carboxylesterase family protein [Duodenibacillus sp.]